MKIAILGRGSLIGDPRGRIVFPETKDAEWEITATSG
jgi:hypothetical protein